MKKAVWGAVCGFALGFAVAASGAEYFVTTNGNDTTGDGTSWATAWATVHHAVANTADNDIITVSNGTYISAVNPIVIGNAIHLRSANGWQATTLDGYAAGGAGLMHVSNANAVVEGLTLRGNASYSVFSRGGAATVFAGTIRNCRVRNSNGYRGPVTLFGGAVLEQCILDNNTGTDGGGGGCVYRRGVTESGAGAARIENCTIVNNTGRKFGGIRFSTSAHPTVVTNTIIYHNTSSDGDPAANMNALPANSIITHSCVPASEYSAGIGNVGDDPLFIDRDNADYRLDLNSPCRDAGTNLYWMTAGVTDIGGSVARIMPVGGVVDIGAYEYDTDALVCSFTASPLAGFGPQLSVTFTSSVAGAALTGLGYQWDFGNDGNYEVSGSDKASFTTNLWYGTYTVALRVTNDNEEVATFMRTDYIKCGPTTAYVARAANVPAFPYLTPATAASNVNDAADAGIDGTLVLVDAGRHPLTNTLTIGAGISVLGVHGALETSLDGMYGNYRGVEIYPGALLEGFTLTNAYLAAGMGLAIYFRGGGTVQNCVIKHNTGGSNHRMVYGEGGGLLRNCVVRDNYIHRHAGITGAGAGITAENCLIFRNTSNYSGNTPAEPKEGIAVGGNVTLRNCIVMDNTNLNVVGTHEILQRHLDVLNIDHTLCPHEDTAWTVYGTGNLTNRAVFRSVADNDLRLHGESPGVDAGMNLAWIVEPGATDLLGNPRLQGAAVDLGPYESPGRGLVFYIR